MCKETVMTLDVKLKASSTPAGKNKRALDKNSRIRFDEQTEARTIAVVQVNIHVEDSLVLLPQSEDSQHCVVHVTETRRLVPADRRGHGISFVHLLDHLEMLLFVTF